MADFKQPVTKPEAQAADDVAVRLLYQSEDTLGTGDDQRELQNSLRRLRRRREYRRK